MIFTIRGIIQRIIMLYNSWEVYTLEGLFCIRGDLVKTTMQKQIIYKRRSRVSRILEISENGLNVLNIHEPKYILE